MSAGGGHDRIDRILAEVRVILVALYRRGRTARVELDVYHGAPRPEPRVLAGLDVAEVTAPLDEAGPPV